jgi:acetaldehyde dehydrogenase
MNIQKINVAILGTGNIGADLMMKVLKSPYLECKAFIGRNANSKNIELASKLNVPTSINGIKEIEDNPSQYDIVFDATSAQDHIVHADILNKLDIPVIDLTPAKIGSICVPIINGKDIINKRNINLITCGGQASMPIVHAIANVEPNIDYIEVVTTVASVCAGPATRANLDEYLNTTEFALKQFSGCNNVKAMLNLNPAVPEMNMQVTIKAIIKEPNLDNIKQSVQEVSEKVKKNMPGYELLIEPKMEGNQVVTMLRITGAGDYLPKYAGSLDIITQAAITTAEHFAQISKNIH